MQIVGQATIRDAVIDDAEVITAIYNQGIEDRSATFETRLREVAELRERIADSRRYPLLVVCDGAGRVAGWASLSSYRSRPCYAGIAEFSIYLSREHRGQGLGHPLLQALIERAAGLGFHKLIARIFIFNAASRALSRRCGFREVGVYQRHGQLDGRWLDVVIVERWLGGAEPEAEVDTAIATQATGAST